LLIAPLGSGGLDVSLEIVEDGLPAATLHIDRIVRFRIKRYADAYAVLFGTEFHLGMTIAEIVFDQLGSVPN
jgi:hypothetical protein